MSRHGLLRSLFAAAALLGAAGVFAASAEPLRLEVYNPGEKAIFAVSSELLVGQREAMLIDAQFSRADAEQLVKRIQASGKTLSTIYISHGDPDFYFGLDVLKAAFPEAKILATAQTVAHIQATSEVATPTTRSPSRNQPRTSVCSCSSRLANCCRDARNERARRGLRTLATPDM